MRYSSKLDGPVNFVVGGFSQNEKNDFRVEVVKIDQFGTPDGPFSRLNSDDALSNPDGNTFFGRFDNNKIKQYAAFGEVTWTVTDQLTLAGRALFPLRAGVVPGPDASVRRIQPTARWASRPTPSPATRPPSR